MTPPTLKQIIEKASKPTTATTMEEYEIALDAAQGRQLLAARCSPSVMLAVLSALESCRWAKVAGAHPEWCMKYDETKVKSALNALNGKAP